MNPVSFYKCFADDTRLKCLLLIQQEQELCVCELTTALDEIQPKISRHLALLRKSGLLVDRRQGQWIFYRINPELPTWCLQVISTTEAANNSFLSDSVARLHAMGERPERAALCCHAVEGG
ncbi:metalloregulator ArsR/SmtB family transcription factor [Amphritea balenae]|uniref:ArsR family transcriptional regulator n=1 Tax=Amphritea balenae TaxID=452629 RepID=A0A3P1SU20_9GAMM|nr:metalloregulator ArsR/SmtB family transcription factor [Amphritea balenae]RRD00425.1 ArsR family transcriptional regulator [Amphritea balenae]GGK70937.1 transcriptional regulator [Amphritea balenae]